MEDRQPPVREHDAPATVVRQSFPITVAIRTAMSHGIFHAPEGVTVGLSQLADDTCDATHQRNRMRANILSISINRLLLAHFVDRPFLPDAQHAPLIAAKKLP